MANISHLPKTATDAMEVCDAYGTIWRYDIQTNSWISVGTINDSPVVTDVRDGLVSPDIFSRVNAISTEVQNGLNFNFLKIYPHTAGYYYLFQSSNRTITFEPESANDLRIEVSRPRLLSLLSQLKCPGDRGLIGVQGAAGIAGTPGQPEVKYVATIANSMLQVDILVDDSLGTPISFRVYAGKSTTPTIVIKITGSKFEIIQSSIIIDSIFFDYSDGQLVGQITSSQWGSTEWYYKVSQIGRRGATGAEGHGFLEIVPDTINSADLISNIAIILIRQGDGIGAINYFSSALFKTNCVSKLAVSHLCSTTTISLTDSYAALQVGIDNCRNITRYSVQPVVANMPELVLSEWTPTSTCLRQRHLAATKLSWPDFTKVGSDMVPWQKANDAMAADPGYPWSIIEESEPGQLCCQEDFFFCSNVNDITGACPINVVGDLQTPPAPTYGCDCDCPISFLLEGGYEFEDVKITSVGDMFSQAAVCSVNGGLHEYNVTVNMSTEGPIVISVIWQLEYDPICDESRELYKSQVSAIPGFVFDPRTAVTEANCPIGWSATDQSIQTSTLYLRSGDSSQSLTKTGTISFFFNGSLGTIVSSAAINTLRLNCCLGYKLTISVNTYSVTASIPGETGATETPTGPSPSSSLSPSPSPSPSPSTSTGPGDISVFFGVDSAGDYYTIGTFNGESLYRRTPDGFYFVWYDGTYWWISVLAGYTSGACWKKSTTGGFAAGSYAPQGGASGTAHVL